MARRGPLLRLVHSFDRRRAAPTYSVAARLDRIKSDGGTVCLGEIREDDLAPRVFVVGVGDRVDLGSPGGLLPRHIAIVAEQAIGSVLLRVISLHPERALRVVHDDGSESGPVGGVVAVDAVKVAFEDYTLTVDAKTHASSLGSTPGPLSTLNMGEQLGFFSGGTLRPVGDVVSSISGPSAGGFAVPALVADLGNPDFTRGDLVLRTRDGLYELSPRPDELQRGVLVGRSRRCVLGRGFDENDGLSRVHALVMLLGDGVYAFDLASRYGLRDVSRPGKLVNSARLDDGAGCLVYGAGHLIYER